MEQAGKTNFSNKGEDTPAARTQGPQISSIELPKGGGAIRGIGEKFAANPVTGTGSMTIPIATSPGRSGFGPALSLSYDSGAGNGPFGIGWNLSLPVISRKTDKGLPKYQDSNESDVFILSGAEDLVPVLKHQGDNWVSEAVPDRTIGTNIYHIKRYRPRIEGLFARIERWTNIAVPSDCFWCSISKENITTWYGKTSQSRIADPEDASRIFSWLISESYDDKGNAMVYEYAKENSANVDLSQVNERNRSEQSRSSNRYLKRIKYGNETSRLIQPDLSRMQWLFEVVFDYEEGHYTELDFDPSVTEAEQHHFVQAAMSTNTPWPVRQDSFSRHRSGFEVRHYRLCHRVLMFHHFTDELGVDDYLVRSTGFNYNESPIGSFISSVIQSGYKHQNNDHYLKKSLPPLAFEYSQANIHEELKEVDANSLENLPQGLDGSQYRWVDLDGEGTSGILTEQGGAWLYKRNLSPLPTIAEDGSTQHQVRFAPLERVGKTPSTSSLSSGRTQLQDLAGNGQLDVVEFDGLAPGFYERTADADWDNFVPFKSLPNIPWQDQNLKFIDLTGDGHADILITGEMAFSWYSSLAELGFSVGEKVRQSLDEESGPRLVFADASQSIYLSDFSGDGLTDLVRIRNGEVCYWPNLGYGQFGAKVTMDNSPRFDLPDQFEQRRIRLADIDGSGVVDIIYLHSNGIKLYFNQSGNAWSDARTLQHFPKVDSLSSITTVDLLGNGTACLVWSSPLPGDVRNPLRYIDLMGGQKPHLLTRSVNNLGAETRMHYAPSTQFYLADKQAGTPWITRLNFPVHVVERVETYDYISRNCFTTRYAYHHGYFDGIEREFRGFGMVEQWDTEAFATLSADGHLPMGDNNHAASHMPPVLTKTWFHTGAYLDRHRISNYFAGLLNTDDIGEYYREPGLNDAQTKALLLDDTLLPEGLTLEEKREACRALKGSMLRQEVYAPDGTDRAEYPYIVNEQNFTIKRIQPKGVNQHSVFFTHAREAINYNYERNPTDPRITHAMTLEVDEFGNVLKEVAIGYGRRQPDMNLSINDRAKQAQVLVTYTANRVSNVIKTDDDYRTPLPCETHTYELTGYHPTGAAGRFQFPDFLQATPADLGYEENATVGEQRRLIEHIRTLYRPNDLGTAQNDPLALLPLGVLQSLALPGESYKLAFTPGLLDQLYRRNGNRLLPEDENEKRALFIGQSGYVDLDKNEHWWIPSGRVFYNELPSDSEQAQAQENFFIPTRLIDPFLNSTTVQLDNYKLLPVKTVDAVGNTVKSINDYRVLQPKGVIDPNRNRTAVAFDVLGMVVGTAVMGKSTESLGDSLDNFEVDVTDAVIFDHLANPLTDPHAILQRASTRLVYDLFAYQRTKDEENPQPAVVYTLARKTHDGDLGPGEKSKIQHRLSYSDGFGREIQQKIQAEPEKINGVPGLPRWVASGWTIFNNKGKPVRQFEPFFTATHHFEFAMQVGVSPYLFYDPVGRVIATLHPNQTWEKVIFDPWQQESWDVNDTVLLDPGTDEQVKGFFIDDQGGQRLPTSEYQPSWYQQRKSGGLGAEAQSAANKAKAHAGTAARVYFDSLARPFLSIANNGKDQSNNDILFKTRTLLDIEGNEREVIDAKNRIVMRYDHDMLGNRIHQISMEAGARWMLNDVVGNPIRAWDSRGHRSRTEYDPLRRPLRSFVTSANLATPDQELLTDRLIYGEQHPQAEQNNLRGSLYRQLDQAGVVTNEANDFKGNPLQTSRRIAKEYKQAIDWNVVNAVLPGDATAQFNPAELEAALTPLMEVETYTSLTTYDALNRPVTLTTPHTPAMQPNIIRPGYNEANLLERMDVRLPGQPQNGQPQWTPFITNIDYDAKGQRQRIDYGNGVTTLYDYDPLTFRLKGLFTRRSAAAFPNDCPQLPTTDWPGCQVQNLHYTYDPAGNITHIRDDAQQTIYFNNQHVEPSAEYNYDATYRLIEATGREHPGQAGAPVPNSHNDAPRVGLQHPGDGNVMGTYIERYVYDAVGNFLEMQHRGSASTQPGWTRSYAYDETSLIEFGNNGTQFKVSNRLTRTTMGSTNLVTEPYAYDAHGNMLTMNHLSLMQWDYRDQLQATSKQVINNGDTPEVTYYVYDSTGQRVRKITEQKALTGETPGRKEERLYLGGFEIYRAYGNNGKTVALERETLHIMDDKQRVALVETRTIDLAGNDPSPQQLIRYQFANHLGSASLELDDQARVISYEEYMPYGGTSYQAVRSQTEGVKRYRYSGKERDEESGFYYYGARYYVAWLGRWASSDPAGDMDGFNLYHFVNMNPVNKFDPNGLQTNKLSEDNALKDSDTKPPRMLNKSRYSSGRLPPSPTVGDKVVNFGNATVKGFSALKKIIGVKKTVNKAISAIERNQNLFDAITSKEVIQIETKVSELSRDIKKLPTSSESALLAAGFDSRLDPEENFGPSAANLLTYRDDLVQTKRQLEVIDDLILVLDIKNTPLDGKLMESKILMNSARLKKTGDRLTRLREVIDKKLKDVEVALDEVEKYARVLLSNDTGELINSLRMDAKEHPSGLVNPLGVSVEPKKDKPVAR